MELKIDDASGADDGAGNGRLERTQRRRRSGRTALRRVWRTGTRALGLAAVLLVGVVVYSFFGTVRLPIGKANVLFGVARRDDPEWAGVLTMSNYGVDRWDFRPGITSSWRLFELLGPRWYGVQVQTRRGVTGKDAAEAEARAVIARQDEGALREALRRGMSPNMRFLSGDTLLSYAVVLSATNSVRVLLSAGADPNTVDNGERPFAMAVMHGDIATARLLLEYGFDVHRADRGGVTPLMQASDYDQIEIVRELLHRGVSVALRDENSETALDHAVRSRARWVVAVLRQYEEYEERKTGDKGQKGFRRTFTGRGRAIPGRRSR
jgi:hypothetical protein